MLRRALGLLALSLPLYAHAQPVENTPADARGPVPQADAKLRDAEQAAPTAAPEASRVNAVGPSVGYELIFEPSADGRARMKVLEPQGVRCDVWPDAKNKASFETPFSLELKPDHFYRYVFHLPNGTVVERKFEAKAAQTGRLMLTTGFVDSKAAELSPLSQQPQALASAAFKRLLEDLDEATDVDVKSTTLELAAVDSFFTVEQVGRLLDAMPMPQGKRRALEATRARVVDARNLGQLVAHFETESERLAVAQLLGVSVPPPSPPPADSEFQSPFAYSDS